MMNYNLYMDESGNTGNIELRENLEWNYSNQDYFVLGAFYIDENIASTIEEKIINILHKYDKTLGTEKELKSKAKYKFTNALLEDITELLMKNRARFYFDLSNKKYKVMIAITEYCVYPYYTRQYSLISRKEKIAMANFLYRELPLEYISSFINLCQSDTIEGVNKLRDFMERMNQFLKKRNLINDAINIVANYEKYGLKQENLFPIKDFSNKNSKESFLPNVDAFNSIIGFVGRIRLNSEDAISIYHDEQKQFSNVITKWSNELKSRGINVKRIEFLESKYNVMIQVIDFYTGHIMRLYKEIVKFRALNKNDRELIKILKPISDSINVVAPQREQEEFFSQFGMYAIPTTIPF